MGRLSRKTSSRSALLILAMLLVLPACGSRADPSDQALLSRGLSDSQDAASVSDAAVTPSEHGSADGVAPTPTAPAAEDQDGLPASPEASSTPHSREGWEEHSTGVVQVTLSSNCVRTGDVLTISTEGPPNAGLAMIIAFSDNQSHGAMMTGQSSPEGTFTWSVAITPVMPPGEATVLVRSTGPGWGEGGGRALKNFVVAGQEGC